ncbi:MAG: hypothetical protein ACLSGI_12360 [Butyricicoccaceae bacterium]
MFCMYSYTGYALIRQAHEMIRAGVIGDVHVRVQHRGLGHFRCG